MTDTVVSAEVTEQVRQRVMHRTSRVEAMAYEHSLDLATAEARYDADTAVLEETGKLPEPLHNPVISGAVPEPPTKAEVAEAKAEEKAEAKEQAAADKAEVEAVAEAEKADARQERNDG